MQLSLAPILLAVELGFLFALAWRRGNIDDARRAMAPVHLFLLWVATYAIVTSILGARGAFISDALMPWLPGLWLQLITVSAVVGPVLLFAPVRDGLRRIVDVTPLHWFAWFHALRIAALGTAAKTATGEDFKTRYIARMPGGCADRIER